MLSEWGINNIKRLIRVYKKEVEEIIEEQTAYLEQVAKLEEDKKKRLEWIRDLEKQLEEAGKYENAVVKIES
jgi:DNA repair ATPase RecN